MPAGLVDRLLILGFVLHWLVAPLLFGLVVFRLLRLPKRAIPGAAGFCVCTTQQDFRRGIDPNEENWEGTSFVFEKNHPSSSLSSSLLHPAPVVKPRKPRMPKREAEDVAAEAR